MKTRTKKILIIPTVILISIIVFLMILDSFILPFYISADEYRVPDVIGKNKDEAIAILKDMNLNPIVQTSRYDERFKKDQVIFQKPMPNTIVKENRRIYLTISGGEQTVKMPFLINKTLRDAQITLERLGLAVDSVEQVASEFPPNTIVEQQYPEGKDIPKGSSVDLKVSIGPQVGMVRVPNLLGRSLAEAENLLRFNSLRIGLKTYISSATLLPNTIVDQQPSENTLVPIGDSVDVVLTQNK